MSLLERDCSIVVALVTSIVVALVAQTRARGYKTFFMLNSIEHEIFPAHKC